MSSVKSASEVCSLLNQLFTTFDDLAEVRTRVVAFTNKEVNVISCPRLLTIWEAHTGFRSMKRCQVILESITSGNFSKWVALGNIWLVILQKISCSFDWVFWFLLFLHLEISPAENKDFRRLLLLYKRSPGASVWSCCTLCAYGSQHLRGNQVSQSYRTASVLFRAKNCGSLLGTVFCQLLNSKNPSSG